MSKKSKPHYYRKKYLTVGMLGDILNKISDKTVPVLIADKRGGNPNDTLSAFTLISGGKDKNKESLVITGRFTWTDEDPDDDDEIDWDTVYAGSSCNTPTEAGDCVVMIPGLDYLDGVPTNDVAVQSPVL